MTGPLSGSNKPGEDDSWESLAEDLFGIDFRRPADGDLADDDDDDDLDLDEVEAPVAGEDDELDAGFPEEDEAEACFPEEDEADAFFLEEKPVAARAKEPPARPRREEPSRTPPRDKPAPVADEGDSFWDALNDWDWSEPATTRRKRPAAPTVEGAEEAVSHKPEPAAENADEERRGPRRRRRGRGRGGRGEGERREEGRGERADRGDAVEPIEAPAERSPARRRRPEPVEPAAEFDDEPELSFEGDEFGAGLLDTAPKRRPQRRPRPAADREDPRSAAERPARAKLTDLVPVSPPSISEDDSDEEESEDEAGRPRRRRRRRRRRTGSEAEVASSAPAPAEEPNLGFDEDENEEPAPRRRRAERTQAEEAPAAVAEPRKPVKGVPTWAEAIGLLVHRRPKQTTGWTPEPEEAEPERRPRGPGGPRRRRRRS